MKRPLGDKSLRVSSALVRPHAHKQREQGGVQYGRPVAQEVEGRGWKPEGRWFDPLLLLARPPRGVPKQGTSP